MTDLDHADIRGRSGPVLTTEAVLLVLGLLAFAAGVTKRWILDPLAEGFGDLSPNAKSVVAVAVVLAVIALIALTRWRRRSAVLAAKRVVERRMDA